MRLFFFHPPLEGEGRARRARGGVTSYYVIVAAKSFHPLPLASLATSPLQGEVKIEAAC
jgi:hypothetical protein